MTDQSDESADTTQWLIEAEDGRRGHASQDIAEAIAAGVRGYTLGPTRSPVVRAYVRPNPEAEWVPLTTPPEQGTD